MELWRQPWRSHSSPLWAGRSVPSHATCRPRHGPLHPGRGLEMYEATVDAATANRLADEGYDVVSTEQVRGGVRIVLVLYPTERKAIEKQGIDLTLWTNTEGVTATELARQQKDAGFKVFQDYDGPDGIRAYLDQIAAANPGLVKLEVIGQTYGTDPEGDGPDTPRDIVALKLTANANTVPDNSRPAALYSSLQHARRMDQRRGQPAPARVAHQDVQGKEVGHREPAPDHRGLVRVGRQPRRLPVHVRL